MDSDKRDSVLRVSIDSLSRCIPCEYGLVSQRPMEGHRKPAWRFEPHAMEFTLSMAKLLAKALCGGNGGADRGAEILLLGD